MKYLYRFTKQDTSFDGWRLAIIRQGNKYVRYFSALEYGGVERAEAAAREIRSALLADLEAHPENVPDVFARYRKAPPMIPAGFRPAKAGGMPNGRLFCAVGLSAVAREAMEELCSRWGIDRTSVLRAGLYLLVAWYRKKGSQEATLQELAAYLDEIGEGCLPPFAAYMRGKSGRTGGEFGLRSGEVGRMGRELDREGGKSGHVGGESGLVDGEKGLTGSGS